MLTGFLIFVNAALFGVNMMIGRRMNYLTAAASFALCCWLILSMGA